MGIASNQLHNSFIRPPENGAGILFDATVIGVRSALLTCSSRQGTTPPPLKRTPSTSRTLVESGGGRINLKGRLSIKKDVVALAALFCDPFSSMGKNLIAAED
jgi:hypothetical protein